MPARESVQAALRARKSTKPLAKGLTADEIAERTGLPVTTVRNTISDLLGRGVIQVQTVERTGAAHRPARRFTLA